MNSRRTAFEHQVDRPRRAFRDVTNENGANNDVQGGKHGLKHAIEKRSSTHKDTERIVLRPKVESREGEIVAFPKDSAPTNNASNYEVTGRRDDIDIRDVDDPLSATSYVEDMYKHFRAMEERTSVRPFYMARQTSINARMRSILVDWMVDVHLKFHLIPETLYLAVNLTDRFLQKVDVPRTKLQLVGVTALLLASKYEEIYPPQVSDIVGICDNAFDDTEVVQMEVKMLRTLHYKITIPSAHCFLVRYLKAGHGNKKIVQYATYILDSTLQNYELLEFLPSKLASAAVLIARAEAGRNPWSPTLLKYTDYFEKDIIPVATAILKAMRNKPSHLDAVDRKYSKERYGAVAGTSFHI